MIGEEAFLRVWFFIVRGGRGRLCYCWGSFASLRTGASNLLRSEEVDRFPGVTSVRGTIPAIVRRICVYSPK
jgi:hypothetical protein